MRSLSEEEMEAVVVSLQRISILSLCLGRPLDWWCFLPVIAYTAATG